MGEVPVLVVPCTEGLRVDGAPAMMAASVLANVLPAMWSFMLAARARGLGTAWTTVHLMQEQAVAEVLGIPFGTAQQVCLSPAGLHEGHRVPPCRPTGARDGHPLGPLVALGWTRPSGGRPRGHRLHAARRGRRALRGRADGGCGRARARRYSRSARTAVARRSGWARPPVSGHGRLRRRPPPRLGGEPGRLGVARRLARRRRARVMDTLPTLPPHHLRRRPGGGGGRRRRSVADRRPPLAHAAGAALHRRRPRRRAGPGRLRGLDAPRRAAAGSWPSTTSSPTRPTAAARPTRTSTCRPWPAAASSRSRRRARSASSAAPASPDPGPDPAPDRDPAPDPDRPASGSGAGSSHGRDGTAGPAACTMRRPWGSCEAQRRRAGKMPLAAEAPLIVSAARMTAAPV